MLVTAAKDDARHENSLATVSRVDAEKVKSMIYISKCKYAYCNQCPYQSTKEYGLPS